VTSAPKHRGAVVVGGDYQGLGIVRSLGRRGIPTCVVDDERSIARFSRYATHAVRVDDLRDEKRTIEHLLTIGRKLDLAGWVLFPTREETVAALSRHRDVLAEHYRVPTPGWDVVRWAWDKRNTYERAADLGIPTPKTWHVTSEADLDRIDGAPPFVLKPAIKEHFIYATGAKAWRADTVEELRSKFRRAVAVVGGAEVIIQELIPGSGPQQVAYCSLFKEGRSLASMTVCRLRQHPPEFGRASTFVKTIDLPEIEELSERFLAAIGYYGLVELEYKLDRRDNRYKLLDVNARTWGYHSLGPRAGVDFPALLFADQAGEPPGPRRARPGIFWIRLVTDLPTALNEIRHRRLTGRNYLRSLFSSHEEAVFSLRDPLPGLAEIALLPYLAVKRGF
jgi:predicted ATP-grasp superfamily ATP-dependent carboligase